MYLKLKALERHCPTDGVCQMPSAGASLAYVHFCAEVMSVSYLRDVSFVCVGHVLKVSVDHVTIRGDCRLVSEYMQLAPSDMLQDCVENLSGEAVIRMVHTHDGCRVGCMVAAYSTPKQRKKLVKAMKGHVTKFCADEFAYVTLIKVLESVDDTELVRKTIVAEIQVCRQ